MKVITLWQPWASLIYTGRKTIETRTHSRFGNLVGETIGIHAGKIWDKDWKELAGPYLTEMEKQEMCYLKNVFDSGNLRGQIICTATVDVTGWLCEDDSEQALIDCSLDKFGMSQKFGLFLTDIKPIKKIPAKGKQGIWNYDGEIVYV